MGKPSLPDPAPPVKLLGHLSFVGARPAAAGCFVCRHSLADEALEVGCERCGFEPLYHYHCYVDAIARGRAEAAFWASSSADECDALVRSALFLCPGCRS